MTQFLLIRHGATDVMLTHLAGRTPGIPLNGLGRAQAQAVAQRLRKPAVLVTSPIQRACETAEVIGGRFGMTAPVIHHFAEFDFGDWTGVTFNALHEDPRWNEFNRFRETVSAPGGESMKDVQRRAVEGLEQLAAEHGEKTIAIVSHGDVIRSLLLHAAGSAIGNYWRFAVNPASISELGWESGAARMIRANDCAHLEHLTE